MNYVYSFKAPPIQYLFISRENKSLGNGLVSKAFEYKCEGLGMVPITYANAGQAWQPFCHLSTMNQSWGDSWDKLNW